MEPPRTSRRSGPAGSKPRHHRPDAEPDRPGLAARRAATRLLAAVVDTQTSADGLTDRRHGHADFLKLDARDQGLVKAILLTSLRHRGTISAIVEACLERPLPGKAASLRHILHTGAAQVLFLDVPDSAAVDLAVAQAASDSRTERFASLVNAILRRIGREKEALLGRFDDPELDCPPWLFRRLVADHGETNALAIAQMHRLPAPLDVTAKGDPQGVAEALGGTVLPFGTVRLAGGEGAVSELPGFGEGDWWVQDAAASLPARLFGDIRDKRVVDACAAPGGKTAQLAAAGARVTALDISASRMRRLRENLGRLGLEAEFVVTDLGAFTPPEPFDAVLLDAPCSSTGTIRRHPDVAYTKDAAEIAKLAQVQARLLREAAVIVKPGGLLVFSNCSLDREEGEDVVAAFLADHAEFALDPVRAEEVPGLAEAVSPEGYLRTTPAMLVRDTPESSGLDGFFAARLRRTV
ncbi:RsmB/NOP family class I SAM-dependent RNA methyltransferase [Aureimonas pseudogalii]|uniref:16S rRNA (Cytosine967-C5)-methyltransferase n=1 Tax=Aureimonas pseudogalii TaxID=1744844 RepID=A0A7W6EFZ1_9HYPH|nr:RsmB/NOP family class I SAM-dependent RNA methyltransferase [Aureimonas pseudogalii]MBB3997528.1 16S rRNA (cytosine967-C5)-methyltransferase [Aureimonas pseudogalii]